MTKNDFKEQLISNMVNAFVCKLTGTRPVVQTKDLLSDNIFEEGRRNRSRELEELAIKDLEAELEKLKRETGE